MGCALSGLTTSLFSLNPSPYICTPALSYTPRSCFLHPQLPLGHSCHSLSPDLRPFLLRQRFSSDTHDKVSGKSMNPLKICTKLSSCVCSFLENRPTAFIRFPRGLCSPPFPNKVKKQYQSQRRPVGGRWLTLPLRPFWRTETGLQLPTALIKNRDRSGRGGPGASGQRLRKQNRGRGFHLRAGVAG